MVSLGAGRGVAAALAVLLVGATLAGTGVVSASPFAPVDATEGLSAASADAGERPSAATDPTGPSRPSDLSGFSDTRAATGLADAPSSASATVTATGGHASVTGTASAVANGESTLAMTQRLHLTPDRPGSIDVTVQYAIPEALTTLRTGVPEGATVTDTRGFARNGTVYEWDEKSAPAVISYRIAVNETRELAGPEGADGRYLFADPGEWALFKRPPVSTTWGWRGGEPVDLSRTVETAGPGTAGDWMVYLGAYDTYERSAHGQDFRLVVPARATLAASPDRVLDTLATAADQLRVGDRDPQVTAFAAPTTAVEWGVRGLQYGDADMYVRDEEVLNTIENTWLHEYTHTRQGYETTSATRWTVEAMATYYGAHLAVQQGLAPLGDLGPFFARGGVPPQRSAVLSVPTKWANAANYWKGSLVAGDLDRRIRVATDSARSLQTVFSRLNSHPRPVRAATLNTAFLDAGGTAVASAYQQFATTPEAPPAWTRATHERVFDATPGRVSVGYADRGAAVDVSGPFRNATLEPVRPDGPNSDGPTYRVYTGETVSVAANVTNAGGLATDYEVPFAVDDEVVATESGPIEPGETVTHIFDRTFSAAGDHVVAVGSDEVAVEVLDPGSASVTALAANRTSLAGPGVVALTATLNNTDAMPARGNVTLTRDGETVADRSVPLGPDTRRSVTVTVRVDGDGRYTFRAGDADPVTVTVGDAANDGNGDASDPNGGSSDGGGESAFGPGVGPVGAFLAVLAGAALLARRRR